MGLRELMSSALFSVKSVKYLRLFGNYKFFLVFSFGGSLLSNWGVWLKGIERNIFDWRVVVG